MTVLNLFPSAHSLIVASRTCLATFLRHQRASCLPLLLARRQHQPHRYLQHHCSFRLQSSISIDQHPASRGFKLCPSLLSLFSFSQIALIHHSSSNSKMAYSVNERGALNSADYRVYFRNADDNPISPWHDIPLFADKEKRIYNMVVEIPRWTNAKMEIATGEPLNPIKQDTKKGALRYVRNPFPHKGYIWNYGAFPQTWEDPNHIDPNSKAKGDNDPIDVLDIGSRVANRGDIVQVKILGTVALIDEGETDWKIITINVEDPLAAELNDIGDVEKVMPGLLRATVEWFKIYKIPDGKPANEFAFNGEAKNRNFAEKIVQETHEFWKQMLDKTEESKLDRKNTTLQNSYSLSANQAQAVVKTQPATSELAPVPIADQIAIDKWYFISTLK